MFTCLMIMLMLFRSCLTGRCQFPAVTGLCCPHGSFLAPLPNRAALYTHGNAGNMACCLDLYRYMHRSGLSVLALDYRGYGDSTGEVSEQGTY